MTRIQDEMTERPETLGFAQHLLMKLEGCPLAVLQSEDMLVDYVAQLVRKIGMQAYGSTIREHCGHASPTTSGFTVVQIIETSLISGHMVDAERTAYWDVMSCKTFDVDAAMTLTEDFFGPDALRWKVLYR